jgi:hypothetical protein
MGDEARVAVAVLICVPFPNRLAKLARFGDGWQIMARVGNGFA